MSTNRITSVGSQTTILKSVGNADSTSRLLSAVRHGLVALGVVGVVSGCAQGNYGSMFSDDRQAQMQAAQQPSLSISRDIDLVRLSGVVATPVEAAMIRLRAASIYGPEMLIDDLQIDDRMAQADWYTAVLDTAESMSGVEQFAIRAENGQIVLSGNVASQAEADALAISAADAMQQQLIVSNEIDYPGRVTPTLPADTEEFVAATLPQGNSVTSAERTTAAVTPSQQHSADAIPSPAVSSTIALPATNSAAVVGQRNVLDATEPELFVQRAGTIGVEDDADGDGIANAIDECDSRAGYPVNARGCQALDGMLKNVRFEGNGSQLTETAKSSLDNVARVLNEYPAARIAILSYTSDFGTPLETRGQARDRARSVVSYLINRGVEGKRLEAYAFGHINNSDDHIMIKEVD
jgi:outer membrane protein OmpA-like peptidoglycan-associated protein